MTVENIGEISTYLEANKDAEEVKGFLNGFSNLDVFKGKITNDAGFTAFMDSEKDKHLSKGIETFKANNLDKIYQERYLKENPGVDPKDKAMNDLRAELAQMKADGQHKELTIKTSKMMQEKKLPMELLELLIGADETITTSNLTALESVFKAHVEELVAERLKGGYQPPTGGKAPATTTKEAFAKMGYSERAKMASENPELYKEMTK